MKTAILKFASGKQRAVFHLLIDLNQAESENDLRLWIYIIKNVSPNVGYKRATMSIAPYPSFAKYNDEDVF